MTARPVLDRLHGEMAVGVPRWAVRAVYAIGLVVAPSCVWRIGAVVFDLPLAVAVPGRPGEIPELFSGGLYVIVLSVLSEALAFLSAGLVCRWGEVFPRWIPGLGGRRVPVMGAVIPAAVGSALLLIFPYALFMRYALDRTIAGVPHGGGLVLHGWQHVVFVVAYLPLAAWGPLLAVLTVHYYRRRRATRALTGTPGG